MLETHRYVQDAMYGVSDTVAGVSDTVAGVSNTRLGVSNTERERESTRLDGHVLEGEGFLLVREQARFERCLVRVPAFLRVQGYVAHEKQWC